MRAERAEHFVLWGTHCDEAAAAIFVTTLRAVGLRVRVVAVSGRRWAGAHGLALTPDLTLGQALRLVRHARCVIIPCDLAQLSGFLNDPRLGEFLACAHTAGVLFVVQAARPLPAGLLMLATAVVWAYPAGAALIPFAQRLAAALGEDQAGFGESLERS